jgi:hypothetical protein
MEPNYGYKHTRGFVVLLVILLCGWVIIAHSQTSYTGNLVGSTWSNGYSVPALTCWQPGDPNCSPGTPYVRPDGNINFSYVATELYQARSLADALPYSGTGLIVTGFQFNWRSKNGNGWDDGKLDVLQAYVQMYSKGGQWIEAQTYNLNFIHNWTDFAWSGTFSKERRGSDLGTILYGFYGKDNNYWMGPYGPEITNVSFSLRYQPDPCVVNPLHSTDCPGFLKAIASPVYQVQESNSVVLSVPTANTKTAPLVPFSPTGIVKLNAKQEQLTQETEVATSSAISSTGFVVSMVNQAPTAIITNIRSNLKESLDNTVAVDSLYEQTSLSQTATINTIIQTAASQTKNNKAKDTPNASTEITNLDQTPVIISQPATVTDISLTTPAQSRSSVQTITADSDTSMQTYVSLFRAPESSAVNQQNTQTNYDLVEPVKLNADTQHVTIVTPILVTNGQSIPAIETTSVVENFKSAALETPAADTQSNSVVTALIDRTNPLNNVLNNQPLTPQTAAVFAGPSVKSNTADNDAAGKVSISQIAKIPAGFDVYQNLAIREMAFYQPREIYRAQRTVDNVRALRSLGQDAKHQEMVDQQYGGRLE